MDPLGNVEIKSWVEEAGGNVDYVDFLSQRLILGDWLAIGRVFHPRFIKVRGCVLWERAYEAENFEAWHDTLNGDVLSIEKVLNQCRLWQFIDFGDSRQEREEILAVSNEVGFFWRASLKEAFPQMNFDVRVSDTEDGPIVGFTSQR